MQSSELMLCAIVSAAGSGMSMISLGFNMFGKFSISAAFTGVGLFTPELYPTSIRYLSFCVSRSHGDLLQVLFSCQI